MGLDTTHDCWHGPYSAFMRWRIALNDLIRHNGRNREDLELAWTQGFYGDQSVPINVLMNHSDCDGRIAAKDCGPLADALQSLLDQLPERALYDDIRPATARFIAGLRSAASKGEDVEFH